MKLDFDVLARVFVAVRPKGGKQGALRAAMFAARVLVPGTRAYGSLPIVRLERVYKAHENQVRDDAEVPMSEAQVAAQALRRTFDWMSDPAPVLGCDVVEKHIREAMAAAGIDRTKLINGTTFDVAAIRHRVWWELREAGVKKPAICKAFRRDHSTVLSGQRKHEQRLLDATCAGSDVKAAA